MLNRPRLIVPATALLVLGVAAAGTRAEPPRVTVNPYADVDWQTVERHHGNFHTHTTESDGAETPADVIDRYRQIGHDVLALTDHNRNTWPWSLFGRDAGELGMIAVPGNELSHHHHTLSLFCELETRTRDHETGIRQIQRSGGISALAHPGRYWRLDGDRVPERVVARYARLFRTYPTLIGMEVVNQGDRYPHDRALWDALLTELMPGRPVWGMANDDSHRMQHVGLNVTVLLLDKFDKAHVRAALEDGRYYFYTMTTTPPNRRDRDEVPVIRRIDHDPQRHTITIAAESAGKPVGDDAVRWFTAGGETVHIGPTLNLEIAAGLSRYVRAEIRGQTGLAFTQPFALTPNTPAP
jgi:hypothetical protein